MTGTKTDKTSTEDVDKVLVKHSKRNLNDTKENGADRRVFVSNQDVKSVVYTKDSPLTPRNAKEKTPGIGMPNINDALKDAEQTLHAQFKVIYDAHNGKYANENEENEKVVGEYVKLIKAHINKYLR